jgi:DNA-binding FadR family transcriptional regulator
MLFHPITTKRTFELVADEIKEAILSGVIKPDERLLSERDLADEMNVSRSAVREALRTLELSGLIYSKKGVGGGHFAKKPDAKALTMSFSYLIRLGEITIDQLTEARLPIEKEIVRLAIRKIKKKEDLKPLEDILSEGFEEYKKGGEFRKGNLRFHKLLAKLSQNPVLIMLNDSILPIIEAFVENLEPSRAHRIAVLKSHQAIINHMKRGNVSAATKKCEEHVLFFAKEYKEMIRMKNIEFKDLKVSVL